MKEFITFQLLMACLVPIGTKMPQDLLLVLLKRPHKNIFVEQC